MKIKELSKGVISLLLFILSLQLSSCKKEEKVAVKKIYTVTFNTNGAKEIEAVDVEDGESIDEPIMPTKDNNIFDGWLLGGVVFNFETPIVKDITLDARWIELYSVMFETQGGSEVETQSVKKGDKAEKPKSPIKEGSKFVEWQLDGETFDFSTPVISDIILGAKWEKDITYTYYNVFFSSDGGSEVKSEKIKEGEKALKPNNPTRNGYVFVEWQLDGKTFDFSTPILKSIRLRAIWIKVFTVTFNSMGGSSVETQSIVKGELSKKPEDPTRELYVFEGWQDGGVIFDFSTPVNENYFLVAKWYRVFTVTFDTGKGSYVPPVKVRKDEVVEQPEDPIREGFDFLGWIKNDGSAFDFSTTIGYDITIRAKWQDVNAPNWDYIKIDGGGVEIKKYKGNEENVLVPKMLDDENVLSLSYRVFDDNKVIKTVRFDNDLLTTIGEYCFYNCTSLETVVLPENIQSIGEDIFHGCTSLSYIDLPNSLSYIGSNAFNGCEKLTSITLPSSLKNLEERIFIGCTLLENIYFPSSITSIGKETFARTGIKSLLISNTNISVIAEFAFNECTSLTTIEFPNTLESIDKYAFQHAGIKDIVFPESLKNIGEKAFATCYELETITVKRKVQGDLTRLIGFESFHVCDKITTKYYPSGSLYEQNEMDLGWKDDSGSGHVKGVWVAY